ncbi:MAG TPA: hypothetical protein VK899_07835, partial [Gemmatimonadales bacterium]|nr:hypothetical protein [Gemmatimonadales bacterium]
SPVFLYPFALNPASWLIVGAFLILLLVYYFGWARNRFRGPVPQGTSEELAAIEREFEQAATELGAP